MSDSGAAPTPPNGASGVLVLSDGSLIWGRGFGAEEARVGEVCFNTAMTGYQEILTDPSYAGQIIVFTFPHIGNVGANPEDMEATNPSVRGLLLREDVTAPSNWRSTQRLDAWLKTRGIVGLAGVDTRALTVRIREQGFFNAVIAHDPKGKFDIPALREQARAWPGLEGMDLAAQVTTAQTYGWEETLWRRGEGFGRLTEAPRRKVVAVDYGVKRNILRCLTSEECAVTVVPATASAEDILRHEPDGVFLSNGPGDPAATAEYAVPAIEGVM
ncbi:MAG: carbamoyl phosphate synthase small subunit, partial [Alphaproteobacteria bacterium]